MVYFDAEAWSTTVGRDLPAKQAVELAKRVTEIADGKTIHRVIITDADDFTNFEWKYGEGVDLQMSDYLIWSNEHRAWWGPGRAGYAFRVADAGRYSYSEALCICTEAMPGRRDTEPLNEIPVLLADVREMLMRFASSYPSHDPEPKR